MNMICITGVAAVDTINANDELLFVPMNLIMYVRHSCLLVVSVLSIA